MKTISQRRLDANRANARKSSGPRTAAGKQRSSRNGLKHGAYSPDTVLSIDDPNLYHAFSAEWFRLYSSKDAPFALLSESRACTAMQS